MSLGIYNKPFVSQTPQKARTANNGKQEVCFGYGQVTHQFFREGEGFIHRKIGEGASAGYLSSSAVKNLLRRCLHNVKSSPFLDGQYFYAGHNVDNIKPDTDLSKVKGAFQLVIDRDLGNVKLTKWSNGTKNEFHMHPQAPLEKDLMNSILHHLDNNNPTLKNK